MKRTENKTGQRIALVMLLFVGVLTVGVGFFRIRTAITGPFNTQMTKADANPLAASAQEDPTLLKTRDTDSDGLSDFDELYVHRTSPYLKDTDSDGFDDKQELDSGHDPNCATGKVCFDSLASKSAPSAGQGQSGAVTSQGSGTTQSALEADLAKLQSLTPVQVRALLKENGFTDEDLKDVDDATLTNLYRQSLEEAIKKEKEKKQAESVVPPNPLQAPSPTGSAQQQITPQEIANLTKPQIIQLLTETGELSQDQIAKLQTVDEQTLRSIFLQAFQNAQNKYEAQSTQ